MIEVTQHDGRTVVTLPGTLDLRAAVPLHDALTGAVAADQPVVVDASAVRRLSLGCIQVLIAAGRAMAGREFVVARPSEALISAFDDLGLFPVMMSWKIET